MTRGGTAGERGAGGWSALVGAGEIGWYLLSLITVQGAAFAIQLYVAAVLPPGTFAIVRTVEAYLGPLLVVGAAGLPSLALVLAPPLTVEGQRELGRRLFVLGAVTGIGAALLTAAGSLALAPPVRTYLAITAGVIALGALSRTLTNFLVGAGRLRTLALATAVVALVSIPAVMVLVRTGGIAGWVVGRYAAEGGLLCVVVLLTWRVVSGPRGVLGERYGPVRLVKTGAVLSASLLLRSLLDNLGPMSAARLGFGDDLIGSYSLATVGITVLLLMPGAFGNLAIRKFALLGPANPAWRAAIVQGVLVVTLVTVVPCLVFTFAHDSLLRTVFPAYQPGAEIMTIVLWATPFRALTALFGGVLVAMDHSPDTLRLNIGCLAMGLVLQWFLTERGGLIGSAWAIVATDLVSALGYATLVAHRSRRLPGTTG